MSKQRGTTNSKQPLTSQRQMTSQWFAYANSEQEYNEKLREKELNEMKLNSHQDLLKFYLLRKSCNKTIGATDESFNQMPDRYIGAIRDIGCSLPSNFEHNARKGPPTQQQFENDKSLLATLLGGYNPPPVSMLTINPLDKETIDNFLTFPPTLKPKEINTKK